MAKSRVCGECKFHLVRGVCPKAEYKKYQDNLLACLSTDRACELFQARHTKDEEPEMGEALEFLHKPGEEECVSY